MNIIIKKLTQDLNEQYLDFFDNRAFSDGNPNGPCYCTGPTMNPEVEKKMVSEFGDDIKGTVRRYATEMLKKSEIEGYLAFDGEISVAWCNAADMDHYVSFVPEYAREIKCGKTMCAVCFEIAPEYRRKGVALALLQKVIEDAKKNGYAAVEGYTEIKDNWSDLDFTGPRGLFEKAGFTEAGRKDGQAVMRYMLND